MTSGRRTCEIEPYDVGEGSVLNPGLSGISGRELGVGEMAPGRKGAGISESMDPISSGPKDCDWEVNCSHERIEPRSFPGLRGFGLKNGELSDEGGAGDT